MKKKFHLFLILFLAVSFVSAQTEDGEDGRVLVEPPSASDQQAQVGPTVKEIEIEYVGPRSVSKEVILSNMRTTVGQPYTPSAVEEDVRNLYATGFFSNLRIYDEPAADGVKVMVIVQPKPSIKEIVVRGMDEIGEDRVRDEIKSNVGDTLSEQKIFADAQAIKDYYQDKGFRNAKVEYKIDVNEQLGRAVVAFSIDEGSQQIVQDIVFKGVKAFEDDQLKDVMKTREENWLSFLNKSGRYKDTQFQEDLIRIRDYYHQHGYIDMRVEDVDYETFEGDSLRIIIEVFEGIPYQVGSVDIQGNTLFSSDQIREELPMLEGDVYSPQGLQDDLQAVRDVYGEKGYIETAVSPEREPNIESGRMDIVYRVQEGPQFQVEKIEIQGNNQTKDKVIRRELALTPGDIYDSVRVDASKKRLENLGYFSKVDVTNQDAGVPGRKNMLVSVEEKRTGSVTFGAGFSTVDSILGFVELQQGNFDITNWPTFTGAGQKFRMRAQYGLSRQDFIVSFTEPWFLNQKLSLGVDLFYNESDYLSDAYNQRRYGGAIRMARALNEFWTLSGRYQFENIEIFHVDSTASSIIKAEEGERTKSSIRVTLAYDTRDDLFITRAGEYVEFNAEGAGGPLMGDTDIWKVGAEAKKYFHLPYDLIFSMGGETGVANSYNGDNRVPIFDRFFVGGSRSVRGFDYRAIGPQDNQGESIGGLTMGVANLELSYPIMDRVRGAVFVDAGFNNSGVFDYSLADYEAGAGFGFRMDLPIGPLRIDFGFPIVAKEYNDTLIKFHFDVGYQF